METAAAHGIEMKAGVCGGKPVIAGTRITVKHIVVEHLFNGRTAEDIAVTLPHLTLAQIYDAMAYYHRHKSEIDQDIAAEDDIIRKVAKQYGVTVPD